VILWLAGKLKEFVEENYLAENSVKRGERHV